jgi:septal ring factor EnvC (AmiA/AmiB activator)
MRFALLILFIFISFYASAQKSKAQLEKEKKENLRKIQETDKILQETKTRKTVSLGQLNALKQKISGTEKLINSISKEVNLLSNEMTQIEIIANAMQNDLENLKKEYALMVYTTSKFRSNYNVLYYVFSSATFNQLFRRMQYLSQYSKERKEQVEQIQKVQESLLDQKERINKKRQEKDVLLVTQRKQSNALNNLKEEKNRLVSALNAKEKELAADLEERRQKQQNLEKLIASVIEAEIKKTAKVNSPSSKVTLTPETEMLSNSFEGNRNKFFWPVASGFISQKFGVQDHEIYKGVKIDNSGIDIQTNKGESVRSIFDGTVEYVGFIPGLGNTIMIKHGEYFTVYSKLSDVTVKKEQKVKTKDVIGEVLTDKDGISELHFEIWKNMVKLNPEAWLYDKK